MPGADSAPIEVEPSAPPRAAVIWLHGLGADGHDFEPIVPELRLGEELPARFVFPHAPRRPVTLNGGMVMRSWYDILALGTPRQIDFGQLEESAASLRALIGREVERGIPEDRIVLAGFSQGGAVALHTGLRYPRRLAGIMALSSYLPTADSLADERSEANAGLPVLIAHGTFDPMIPIAAAHRTRDLLAGLGYPVRWHDYPMPHAVHPAEVRDISAWLRELHTGRDGDAGDGG